MGIRVNASRGSEGGVVGGVGGGLFRARPGVEPGTTGGEPDVDTTAPGAGWGELLVW